MNEIKQIEKVEMVFDSPKSFLIYINGEHLEGWNVLERDEMEKVARAASTMAKQFWEWVHASRMDEIDQLREQSMEKREQDNNECAELIEKLKDHIRKECDKVIEKELKKIPVHTMSKESIESILGE